MSAPTCARCGDEGAVVYGGTWAACPVCRAREVARLAALRVAYGWSDVAAGTPGVEVDGDLDGEVTIYCPTTRRLYSAPAHVALAVMASGAPIVELLARPRQALARSAEVAVAYGASS